jgi:DNA-binding response OmpR family regulator
MKPYLQEVGTKDVIPNSMIKRSSLLLVEEDVEVREALSRALTTENFNVLSASSCREAILAYARNDVDVVLLDLNLGKEDGWNVFQMLKQLRSDLPIVVTSAEREQLENSKAGGASGMLEKPFDIAALVVLLRQTFSRAATVKN